MINDLSGYVNKNVIFSLTPLTLSDCARSAFHTSPWQQGNGKVKVTLTSSLQNEWTHCSEELDASAGRSEPSPNTSAFLHQVWTRETRCCCFTVWASRSFSCSSSALQVPWKHVLDRNEKMKSEERGHLKKPDVRVMVGGGGVKCTVPHR